MKNIKLNLEHIFNFVNLKDYEIFQEKAMDFNSVLQNNNGAFKDYTGWVDLPELSSDEFSNSIQLTVEELKENIDYLVVIGIGGSYLGAKAVIEALSNSFEEQKVLFAGINLSEQYLLELTEFLENKKFGICIISKSGTTTEPAISFRILRDLLIQKVGIKQASKQIVAVTDKSRGALVKLAEKMNFKTFVIPDDIGGRFSVLTPVGLLPIAFAGFDIKKIMKGALSMQNLTDANKTFDENIAAQYAVARFILYKANFLIEILANYNPKLHFLAEWWKQLFGESEGKQAKGIFPASADFTTDLHSLGQYIQDGHRFLFETILNVESEPKKIKIPFDKDNLDNLNYLEGKYIEFVNQKAKEGTLEAHLSGGVPNIIIDVPELSEFYIGQLIYFYEKACGISSLLIDVHPFVQPGVEAYKSNMFRLLGKP